MKMRDHVVWNGVAALGTIPWLGAESAVFWAAGVLIDSDHYLDYLCRNRFRDFSLRAALEFHRLLFDELRQSRSLGLNIGHTVEFQALVAAVWWVTGWEWLLAALLGMLFHWLTDAIFLYRRGVVWHRAYSVIEYFVRWERLKHAGKDPERPYRSALAAMARGDRS